MSENKTIGKIIDATAFWQSEVERCHGLPTIGTDTSNNVYLDSRLRATPTINIEDIWPHAKWVRGHGEDSCVHFCSRCGREAFNAEEDNELIEDLSKYCHCCGSLMDECEP